MFLFESLSCKEPNTIRPNHGFRSMSVGRSRTFQISLGFGFSQTRRNQCSMVTPIAREHLYSSRRTTHQITELEPYKRYIRKDLTSSTMRITRWNAEQGLSSIHPLFPNKVAHHNAKQGLHSSRINPIHTLGRPPKYKMFSLAR